MDQKDILNNIEHHQEKFKDLPPKQPRVEFDIYKRMIYEPIRRLDLKSLGIEKNKQLIGILEIWRNKAANMDFPPDEEQYRDQMIKFAEEQPTKLEKIVKDDSDSKVRSRKQKYNKKRFIWQIIGIVIAAMISLAVLVINLIYR